MGRDGFFGNGPSTAQRPVLKPWLLADVAGDGCIEMQNHGHRWYLPQPSLSSSSGVAQLILDLVSESADRVVRRLFRFLQIFNKTV